MTPELARSALVVAEWLFAGLMFAVFIDGVLSLARRRRRSPASVAGDEFHVGVSSRSQFTFERLRLLIDGLPTSSGRRVRIDRFEPTKGYDCVIVDADHPGQGVSSDVLCIAVFDRTAPAGELPCRPESTVPLSSKAKLFSALDIVSDRPSVPIKIVYAVLVLLALGLIGVVLYGLVSGL